MGGDNEYDELLASLCATMNRRILRSKGLNIPTYPGEAIYVPDMLVAIVALDKYADMHDAHPPTLVLIMHLRTTVGMVIIEKITTTPYPLGLRSVGVLLSYGFEVAKSILYLSSRHIIGSRLAC